MGARYAWSVHGDLRTMLGETSDSTAELGFTGSLRLSGGLFVMGRRVYDPMLRQFLQPDIIDPMTYTYAASDPVNLIDPTGLSPAVPESREALNLRPRPRTDRVCVTYSDGSSGGCVCTDLLCGRSQDFDPNEPRVYGLGAGDRFDRTRDPRFWRGGGGSMRGGGRSANAGSTTAHPWRRLLGRTLGVVWGFPQEILGALYTAGRNWCRCNNKDSSQRYRCR
jgi:RHS repeat-associated protein